MTIEIHNIKYNFKDFLFKKVFLTEKLASSWFASEFLTKWISGEKRFEISTSGTTGTPKKIILKRKWIETSALQTVHLLNLWDEKIICCIPTYKIGGLMMLVRALAGGFDIKIIEPKADPLEDIDINHDYTFISLVPYQFSKILSDPVSSKKLNRFRNILLGGTDINQELLKEINNLSPNVYHTYGMTETCSQIALKKLNNGSWPHFRPNPGIALMANEEGLLSIKGFQTGDEWVHTSDIAKIYPDNSFDFIGRSDFVINTGGFKVFPEQLEQKIKEIFISNHIMADLAVTSKHHNEWGQELILAVNKNIENPPEQIIYILKPFLEKFEMPKRVLKIESIPTNESGKTDRRKIKEMIEIL